MLGRLRAFRHFCCPGDAAAEPAEQPAVAAAKVQQVISELDEAKAMKVQVEQELEQRKVDRTDAGSAIQEATGLREREEAAFAKESGEMQTNIAAMGEAYDLIKKGMGGQLLADHGSVGRAQAGR